MWLMRGKRFLTCSAIFQLPWNLLPKKPQNSPHLLSYNLPVQQHALNPQDVYFLPDLHKITELSRAFCVLLWFSSEKYRTVHTVDVCTRWQKGG